LFGVRRGLSRRRRSAAATREKDGFDLVVAGAARPSSSRCDKLSAGANSLAGRAIAATANDPTRPPGAGRRARFMQ
jgi:hypothetical protein